MDVKKPDDSLQSWETLFNLIDDGYKNIGFSLSQKAIMLLGDTGVGKSTLSAYLAGYMLESIKKHNDLKWEMQNTNENTELKISHQFKSETTIPLKIYSKLQEGLIIYDTPGFNDTKPIQEFANAFYIQRIFETTGALKIVLVVSESFLVHKATFFVRFVENICKIFKNPLKLENCITLVVSQIKYESDSLYAIQERIDGILEDNEDLSKDARKIIGFMRDSIEFFPKPPFPDEYNPKVNKINKLLKFLIEKGKYYLLEKNSINVVPPQQNLSKIEKILNFNQRIQDIVDSLNEISLNIEEVCKLIKNPSNNLQIKPCKLGADYFNRHDIGISYIKSLLGLNSLTAINEWLMIFIDENIKAEEIFQKFEKEIDNLFKILYQYCENSKYQNICNNAKKRVNFLDYINKAYENQLFNVENNWFKNVFTKSLDIIKTYELECANCYKIQEDVNEREYYLEVINVVQTINQHLNNNTCNKQIALCYYYIARYELNREDIPLARKKIKFRDSIEYCLLMIHFDQTNETVYSLLNDLCFALEGIFYKIDGEPSIMEKLFKINEKKLTDIIINFEKALKEELTKKTKNVENFKMIIKIREKLRKMKIYTFQGIIDIMNETPMSDNTSNEKFYAYIAKIIEILNKMQAKTIKISLEQWGNILKSIDIDSGILYKIQNFQWIDPSNLEKDREDYEYFLSMINEEINGKGEIISKNPEIMNVRKKAYFTLGEIYYEKSEYGNALKHCISSMEIDEKYIDALEKIEDIYMINSANFNLNNIKENIRDQLIKYNIEVFRKLIQEEFMVYLNDFKLGEGKRQFFTFYEKWKEFANICYLQDLAKIFKTIENINNMKSYKYLNEIKEIFINQWKSDLKCQLLSSSKMKKFKSMTSQGTSCDEISFIITIIIEKYYYIEKLCSKKQDNLKLCFEVAENKLFLGNKQENVGFLEGKISNFQLLNVKNIEYYKKILEIINDSYQNNIKCMNLASITYFRMGEIENKIEYYEKSIIKDQILKELCGKEKENRAFYSIQSKRRENYEKIAILYQNQKNLEKALEFYELRENHYEIKKILKKIQNMENIKKSEIFEKFGDYYKEVGMSEKAIDFYNMAAGLIYEGKKLAEINCKKGQSLENIGPQGILTSEIKKKQENFEIEMGFFNEKKRIFKDFKIQYFNKE